MQFRARAAGAGVAHHPEIVLLAAGADVDHRVEASSVKESCPVAIGLLVKFAGLALGLVRLIDSGVDAFLGELPNPGNEFPGPLDGLLLEIIAEGPVPQHLEERVVVGVKADVFEVVVLAAGADALLGVGGPPRRVGALHLAEEDGHELVHAGVGEEEVRRVRHQRTRRHDGVLLRPEEVEVALANLRAGHGSAMFRVSRRRSRVHRHGSASEEADDERSNPGFPTGRAG